MTPICLGVPTELSQRLLASAMPGWLVGSGVLPGWETAAAPELVAAPPPRCWISATPDLPLLAEQDVWLQCVPPASLTTQNTALHRHAQRATLTWQDSPFAVEHGFMLFAGGKASVLQRAAPILDALAPMPGGWLHAGDEQAPVFIALVARQLGLSITQLAGLAMRGGTPDWLAIPYGQREMMNALASLAASYLASTEADGAVPLADVFPSMGLFSVHAAATTDTVESPARQLAEWLIMLAACMSPKA